MPASPLDSAIYRDLFLDAETAPLFTDSAEVRAMLLVEGALARVQGELGLIPELSATAIHRASMELQIDPAGLAAETGQSAVVVPALVKAFRAAMQAPEHAQYVHWGATSQDIMDTALVLRLRRVIAILETRLADLIRALGILADEHATLPMAGRTYAQIATPVSFGAVVASWGTPLLRLHTQLDAHRDAVCQVSLSGAAGTLSALGDKGPETRAALARALDLRDPGASWHSTRDAYAGLSGWMTQIAASLGKMGEDLILMGQSGMREVTLGQSGGSSTMPQKQNPVQPSLLSSIARQVVALNSVMQGAAVHRQQRDGVAWLTEWLSLPQLCLLSARALGIGLDLARGIAPDAAQMQAGTEAELGLIHAESLSFALAAHMPRPEAQAAVKALCLEAKSSGKALACLTEARWPDLALGQVFSSSAQLGSAPADARAFAASARMLG